MDKRTGKFIWDAEKEKANIAKHGIDFTKAIKAFFDSKRKIFTDSRHSLQEERYFCIGKVGTRIITASFTYREGLIRIIGAGYWRKGRANYEKE